MSVCAGPEELVVLCSVLRLGPFLTLLCCRVLVLCCAVSHDLQLRRFMTAVGDYNCTLQADQAGANSSSNNSPGSNTTSKRGRRLLDGEQQQQQQADTRRRAVLEALYSCKKLEAGALLVVSAHKYSSSSMAMLVCLISLSAHTHLGVSLLGWQANT